MKRKELYEFIREGIIEELSLNEAENLDSPSAKTSQQSQIAAADAKIKYADAKLKAAQDAIKAANDLKTKATQEKAKTSSDQKPELEEMARIPNKIRLGDAAKIALAKELYGPETIEGRLIAAIEGSEGGLTQKELGAALGITIDSKLNPLIQKLAFAQVLAKPAKAATTEPEPTVEPETDEELPTLDSDEEPVDDYEKPEEEESVPEEPKSKEEIEKDKLAQAFKNLSDEETKKFNGFLTSVKKNKDDKAKIDAILKLAKDKKFSPTLMNFLFNAAGRDSLKNI